MRLSDVRARRASGRVRLSCRATTDVSDDEWWFEVEDDGHPQPVAWCAPFLPAAALVAAARGEDLDVEAALDPVQVEGLGRASERYQTWWGWRVPYIRQVGTVSAGTAAPVPRSGRVLLYSRGVDSGAELAASLLGDSPAVDQLVLVVGTDRFTGPDEARRHRTRTATVATAVDRPLRVVTTNLRECVEAVVGWEDSHGVVMVGAGLVAGGPPSSLVVAQPIAAEFEAVRDRPHGLRHDLVPCWSTSTTSVEGGDPSLDRLGKTEVVLQVPAVADAVHVCWEGGTADNCGQCEKCLRTATVLALLDRQDLVDRLFVQPLSAHLVRRLRRPDTSRPGVLEEVLIRVRDAVAESSDPLRRELFDAWGETTSRSGNGDQAGLAGLDVSSRLRAGGRWPDGPPAADLPPLGWGSGAVPHHLTLAEREAVPALSDDDTARPVPWCQVDRLGGFAVRVAAGLAASFPGGSVLVVAPDHPTAPPWAVRRLLARSRVRCWSSEQDHLEAVPLLESVLSGCVPVQVVPDAARVRAGLPVWAHDLVRELDDVVPLVTDPVVRRRTWDAAVALAVQGSCERDARLLRVGERAW